VRRLVLVHFNPLTSADDPIGRDAARRIFPHTDLGLDQQVIEF
jgi:ribonuclease BN (tRNA processing enzyme)